jgi:hypothetical protein
MPIVVENANFICREVMGGELEKSYSATTLEILGRVENLDFRFGSSSTIKTKKSPSACNSLVVSRILTLTFVRHQRSKQTMFEENSSDSCREF